MSRSEEGYLAGGTVFGGHGVRPREERASMKRWTLHIQCAVVVMAVLVLVGCAGTSSRESTGEFVDDSAITTKVKSSFVADPMVSALAINVETTKGVVHLQGIVNNEQERQRAIQLAQAVGGVKQVDARNLFVKS
jgi:hyperosmotically inducible periplasmic protein